MRGEAAIVVDGETVLLRPSFEGLVAAEEELHASVEGGPSTNPPTAPFEGESWLVAEGAVDDWAGRNDSLATWTAGGWRFTAPVPGMTAWDKAAGCWLHWSGTTWLAGWPVEALIVGGEQVVGARQPDIPSPSGGTTIDVEARTAIDLVIVTLKTHGLID